MKKFKNRIWRFFTHAWAIILDVDWPTSIDRLFRYFQMLVVCSIFSVVISAISETLAKVFLILFSILAGVYLIHPLFAWLDSRMYDENGGSIAITKFYKFQRTVFFSLHATVLAWGLTALLSATVNINKDRARLQFDLWNAELNSLYCHGGIFSIKHPKYAFECDEETGKEISRIRSELKNMESR